MRILQGCVLPDGTSSPALVEVLPCSLGFLVIMERLPPPPCAAENVGACVLPALRKLLDFWGGLDMFHGDLHIRNVSYDPDTHKVALLDFDSVRVLPVGHPDRDEWIRRSARGLQYVVDAFLS
jgi:hypothetical protein